jgi:DNA-binding PadR family transcriptional regulator
MTKHDALLQLLIIIIIYRLPTYADAYSLGRMIEWKFKSFEWSRMISDLESDEYIKVYRGPVPKYRITPAGKKLVEENINNFRETLITAFPSEVDFLSGLLDSKRFPL